MGIESLKKNKSIFVCSECGYETSGWLGKCPSCNSWNTLAEELSHIKFKASNIRSTGSIKPVNINDIKVDDEERYSTGIGEMDRVLGGGIVKGSLILVGGDPGIGKSTLLLQICEKINTAGNILYVSGEESVKQIKLRADRLKMKNSKMLMISETNFRIIEQVIENEKLDVIIIDSIQTVFSEELTSAPGSVSQVREMTSKFMRIAKTLNVTIILVGHVTKEGAIAGPRILEHMVDTVLYFEGDRHLTYRILRAVKNRFGSTNEIGIFEMKSEGLEEVSNPSSVMLSERPKDVPGSVVVSSVEGTRPMLIEVQALVSPTNFGMPRRMATGIDYNKIVLLMAVLEKRVGMQLQNFDAYVNVVGGLRLDEPAVDLGIAAAIASSLRNQAINEGYVLIGEIGLTGEIRAVSQIDKRIMEAMRIGFHTCIIPSGNMKSVRQVKEFKNINIKAVENIQQVIGILF